MASRARLWLAVLIPAALLLPAVAPAQVYKCTGKDGRVTYSQTRPRGAECQENAVKPAPKIGSDVEGLMKYAEEIDESRKIEAHDQQQARRDQAQRQQRCQRARAELALLQQASRVFQMDEKGERHYQDEATKQRMQAAAQQTVTSNCD